MKQMECALLRTRGMERQLQELTGEAAGENRIACAWRKQTNLDVGSRTKEPSILIPTMEREPDRTCLPGAGRKGE
jgi:hypothetical protein